MPGTLGGWQRRIACYGHCSLIASLISFDVAKMMDARSPCIPAPTATGFPGAGPTGLESVLNRRLYSQTFSDLPSAVSTVYVSLQWRMERTCAAGGTVLRSGFF